jgi:hypothetical protein
MRGGEQEAGQQEEVDEEQGELVLSELTLPMRWPMERKVEERHIESGE